MARGLGFLRNPFFLVDGWEDSADQAGCMEFDCSFSSTWQKTNQKKTPVSSLTLRVVGMAGARGNSPAFRQAQTVRALIPDHATDAQRWTKGMTLTT
jgi:hypothetical protein